MGDAVVGGGGIVVTSGGVGSAVKTNMPLILT